MAISEKWHWLFCFCQDLYAKDPYLAVKATALLLPKDQQACPITENPPKNDPVINDMWEITRQDVKHWMIPDMDVEVSISDTWQPHDVKNTCSNVVVDAHAENRIPVTALTD